MNNAILKVDLKLHHYSQPSAFVWTAALQDAYPKDEYWWLYAKPPQVATK